MQRFENQTVPREQCPLRYGPKELRKWNDYTQNVFLQDIEFANCSFIGEGLVTYGAPVGRSTAQDIRLTNCAVNSFFGMGAIFQDLIIDGLRTSRAPAILDGCAFRHVSITGKCGRFLLNRDICYDDDERNAAFRSANAAFYEAIDWALDISSAKTAGLEIRGSMPTHLIRRNPDEHFIMTRSIAQIGDWKNYEPFSSFQIAVSIFLESGADNDLFVARHSKQFKEEMEYFHRLKTAGLVT